MSPNIKTFFFLIAFLFAASSVSALWQGPTQTPPGGNVSAPVNVGDNAQIKEGNLTLNAANSFLNGLLVPFGKVGIGTTNPGQKLSVAGTIESTSGGVKFPDGTIQTSAATAATSITLSQEYSVAVGGRGSQSLNIGEHKACFLTKIYTADGGESCDHWCKVYPDGSNWTLYAYEAWDCPGSASVQCSTRCID